MVGTRCRSDEDLARDIGRPWAYMKPMRRTHHPLDALFDAASRSPALAAQGLIQVYRYSLSGLMGRTCRHLPSCSEYTHEAIGRHGLWAGGWMGVARICRCGPGGTSGIDNVPEALPASATWYKPWAYGRWRGVNAPPAIRCEEAAPDGRAPRT